MPEMGIAYIADYFGAYHAVGNIAFLAHIFRVERLEVAGPAATGIELGIRLEQRRAAAHAGINAALMMVEEGKLLLVITSRTPARHEAAHAAVAATGARVVDDGQD